MVVAILFSAETGEIYPRTHPTFTFDTKDQCMVFVNKNYYGLGNALIYQLEQEQSSDTVLQIGCGEFSNDKPMIDEIGDLSNTNLLKLVI